jgi:hypothetical protein
VLTLEPAKPQPSFGIRHRPTLEEYESTLRGDIRESGTELLAPSANDGVYPWW